MSGYEHEPDRVWDEYEWERFLQQQDHKTEKYMELLEKYLDDPQRDQIIAREMGWHHLLDKDGQRWAESVDALFEEEYGSNEEDAVAEAPTEEGGFEVHPLYKASFALTVWLDQLFEELGEVQTRPAAVKLSTQIAIASAKLAAALNDDDVDEIGMTLAYLKRALKAVMNGIEASVQLREDGVLDPARAATLTQRLFQIRDGTIQLMGEYRCEWRRRHESE